MEMKAKLTLMIDPAKISASKLAHKCRGIASDIGEGRTHGSVIDGEHIIEWTLEEMEE